MSLLEHLPKELPAEIVEILVADPSVRIERIVSLGHASPPDFWYDQAQPEAVLLLTGAARLEFENEAIDLLPGSFVNIPARRRHRVAWTDPSQHTVWLAIHYGGASP